MFCVFMQEKKIEIDQVDWTGFICWFKLGEKKIERTTKIKANIEMALSKFCFANVIL